MTILYLFIWLAFIGAEVYRNFYLIEKRKTKPIYLQSFIFRGMAAIAHGILFNPENMADYLPIFIFQITSFWLLFDLMLNYLRRKPALYMGEQSGWIDRAFTWINSDGFTFFCKLLAFLVCVFSVIVIIQQ